MLPGINAGFGDTIKHDLPEIGRLGFQVVRQDLYAHFDEALARQLLEEFVGEPVIPLFIIGGGHIQVPDESHRIEPHELSAWSRSVVDTAAAAGLQDYYIEIGNEPDIAHDGYSKRPQDFAEAIRQCRNEIRGGGFNGPIITGGISNLTRERLNYLAAVVAAGVPDDVVIGFHRYPPRRRPSAPHKGFKSRQAEWDELRRIAGNRRIACTEFGYDTAKHRGFLGFNTYRRSDREAADGILFDFGFYRDHDCDLAVLYQLNDGPTDTPIDRFGIRTADGTPKPLAELIRVGLLTMTA